MMSSRDLQMCVADVMQDDDLENIDSILRMLNNEHDSWRSARGSLFTFPEVQGALEHLIAVGFVKACAEQPPLNGCRPVPAGDVGTRVAWNALWFHLDAAGRDAVRQWWETEGHEKYPTEE
jgi:hypothetical protein